MCKGNPLLLNTEPEFHVIRRSTFVCMLCPAKRSSGKIFAHRQGNDENLDLV